MKNIIVALLLAANILTGAETVTISFPEGTDMADPATWVDVYQMMRDLMVHGVGDPTDDFYYGGSQPWLAATYWLSSSSNTAAKPDFNPDYDPFQMVVTPGRSGWVLNPEFNEEGNAPIESRSPGVAFATGDAQNPYISWYAKEAQKMLRMLVPDEPEYLGGGEDPNPWAGRYVEDREVWYRPSDNLWVVGKPYYKTPEGDVKEGDDPPNWYDRGLLTNGFRRAYTNYPGFIATNVYHLVGAGSPVDYSGFYSGTNLPYTKFRGSYQIAEAVEDGARVTGSDIGNIAGESSAYYSRNENTGLGIWYEYDEGGFNSFVVFTNDTGTEKTWVIYDGHTGSTSVFTRVTSDEGESQFGTYSHSSGPGSGELEFIAADYSVNGKYFSRHEFGTYLPSLTNLTGVFLLGENPVEISIPDPADPFADWGWIDSGDYIGQWVIDDLTAAASAFNLARYEWYDGELMTPRVPTFCEPQIWDSSTENWEYTGWVRWSTNYVDLLVVDSDDPACDGRYILGVADSFGEPEAYSRVEPRPTPESHVFFAGGKWRMFANGRFIWVTDAPEYYANGNYLSFTAPHVNENNLWVIMENDDLGWILFPRLGIVTGGDTVYFNDYSLYIDDGEGYVPEGVYVPDVVNSDGTNHTYNLDDWSISFSTNGYPEGVEREIFDDYATPDAWFLYQSDWKIAVTGDLSPDITGDYDPDTLRGGPDGRWEVFTDGTNSFVHEWDSDMVIAIGSSGAAPTNALGIYTRVSSTRFTGPEGYELKQDVGETDYWSIGPIGHVLGADEPEALWHNVSDDVFDNPYGSDPSSYYTTNSTGTVSIIVRQWEKTGSDIFGEYEPTYDYPDTYGGTLYVTITNLLSLNNEFPWGVYSGFVNDDLSSITVEIDVYVSDDTNLWGACTGFGSYTGTPYINVKYYERDDTNVFGFYDPVGEAVGTPEAIEGPGWTNWIGAGSGPVTDREALDFALGDDYTAMVASNIAQVQNFKAPVLSQVGGYNRIGSGGNASITGNRTVISLPPPGERNPDEISIYYGWQAQEFRYRHWPTFSVEHKFGDGTLVISKQLPEIRTADVIAWQGSVITELLSLAISDGNKYPFYAWWPWEAGSGSSDTFLKSIVDDLIEDRDLWEVEYPHIEWEPRVPLSKFAESNIWGYVIEWEPTRRRTDGD